MEFLRIVIAIVALLLIAAMIALAVNSPTYTVVFLRKPDCPACDYAELQWIANEPTLKVNNIHVFKYTTTETSPLMAQHGVKSLPAVVVYENDKIVSSASGSGDGTPDMVNDAVIFLTNKRLLSRIRRY
nr:hypothetical protein K-LCC10_0391 [Kaumoebavirus]